MSRLTKKYPNGFITVDADNYTETQETIDSAIRNSIPVMDAVKRLAEYEDAEKQGLLVRLPCKLGDTVYEAQKDGTIQKWYINSFEKYDGIAWKVSAKDHKNKWRYVERTFSFDSFGKTVFLTEQALKEVHNDQS